MEDENFGKIIRLKLEEEIKRFPHRGHELQIALSSKAECLLFLQDRYDGHFEKIFSHIITMRWSWISKINEEEVHYNFSFSELVPRYVWVKRSRVKRTVRKRGYRDHGTLGRPDQVTSRSEEKKDAFLSEKYQEILEDRRAKRSLFQILLGYFQ